MKYIFRFPWKIFIIIFLFTNILGYVFDIAVLKIYTKIEKDISYSLASTVIPILMSFLFDYIYQIYNVRERKHK